MPQPPLDLHDEDAREIFDRHRDRPIMVELCYYLRVARMEGWGATPDAAEALRIRDDFYRAIGQAGQGEPGGDRVPRALRVVR